MDGPYELKVGIAMFRRGRLRSEVFAWLSIVDRTVETPVMACRTTTNIVYRTGPFCFPAAS